MKNGLDREHLEDGVMNRKSLPPDKWIEIPTLVVWGQTPYLSVREAPHNNESLQVGRNEIKGGWVYIHGSLIQKKHILFIWIWYVRRYYSMGLMTC